MAETRPLSLQEAALASELLSGEQLQECLAEVRADLSVDAAQDELDEPLAEQLVAAGHVTAWQADQLKRGRTRFHLGPYEIVDAIGVGGMGQVFKGEHAMMGRTVAVKVLPRDKTTPESIQHFAHEVRAQARVDHPNLVRAYDAGHDGNVYYLVTEYVPGSDLRTLVRRMGRLSQRDAATIVSQVARGLHYIHTMGLVHRDCKPGNVLITPEGQAKLSDLGLAGFLASEVDADDPRAGKIVGTVDYLAPEQILKPDEVTPSCDIYALGCTMYYAVTGKVPFPGGTNREKCYRHCHEAPLNPRRFHPDLSPEFLNVMADMMEKDPQQRIETAAQVEALLAPWSDESAFGQSMADDGRWADGELGKLERGGSGDTSLDLNELLDLSDEPESLTSRRHDSQSTQNVVAATTETTSIGPPPRSSSSDGQHDGSRRFSLGEVVLITLAVSLTAALATAILVAIVT
ncbi:MAG: serine/threonine protein kinase [Planctomycetota bacterium]|nr:MAG: serine/threonine protein kinase [Planctomycetota bacterium]REJ90966.1 MAG: serine/threonine protein kinase [Planctomycetota bacterium]